MHDDVEDEYFLGDGGDGGDGDGSGDRRSRRGALIGLAVVVVLVAVAITLTSLLVDTSADAAGPRTAALRWAAAVVHDDNAARHRLECAQGSAAADRARLALAGATDVSADGVRRLSTDRWLVSVQIDGPHSGLEPQVSVYVLRESGRYVVC